MSLQDIHALVIDGQHVSLLEVLCHARNHQILSALQSKTRQILIERYARTAYISVGLEELQQGIDEFRREYGLLQVAAAKKWLRSHGMTLDDMADAIRDRLIEAKVEMAVCQGRVEPYFYEHRLAFDSAVISMMELKEVGAAWEIMFRIEEGGDFHSLAREYSTDEMTRQAGGFFGEVLRLTLSPADAAAVFGATAGEIVGPVKAGDKQRIYKVEKIQIAVLDEKLRKRISSMLFEEWVTEQWNAVDLAFPLWDQLSITN